MERRTKLKFLYEQPTNINSHGKQAEGVCGLARRVPIAAGILLGHKHPDPLQVSGGLCCARENERFYQQCLAATTGYLTSVLPPSLHKAARSKMTGHATRALS